MPQPQYELTQLIHEPSTGRVFIEVQFKGFPIQKWYDPSIPEHVSEITILTQANPNAIKAIVNQLGNELRQALKHPDVGILDQDDNVTLPQAVPVPKVDLLKGLKNGKA